MWDPDTMKRMNEDRKFIKALEDDIARANKAYLKEFNKCLWGNGYKDLKEAEDNHELPKP